jgi:cysteine synthase B
MQTTLNYRSPTIPIAYGSGRHHIIHTIGNTPLIELRNITRDLIPVKIFAKAEWFNPGGSIKDRAALNMILDGINRGELNTHKRILDASSGNTGIAYAMIGAALGYGVTLCIPKNAGEMHKQMITAYGAEIIFTDPMSGTDGAIIAAKNLVRENPGKYYYVDQYNNPKNWEAHYNGTGAEIIKQTNGSVTHFVAALGSTGTFVGAGRRLKKYNPDIQLIAVQPDSPLHGLEGMKHLETAIVPGIYDDILADQDVVVSTEESQKMVRRLASEEGLLVGNSAGGALTAAIRLAENLSQGIIVVIFPDGAHKYLAQNFWRENGSGN